MRIKRNISILALAGIFIVGLALPTYAEEISSEVLFKDLEKNKQYTETISELSEKGVLKGHNGLVRPHDNITRAEYAQTLHNIMKEEGLLYIRY